MIFVSCILVLSTQVEVPEGQSVCPGRPRWKFGMSRPYQTENAYVQIFVRSPDFSCVQDETLVRSPDYSCVHDQTFVRSPDLSCFHQTFRAFMSRLSSVHQTFRAFFLVSRPCKFERTTPPSCIHLGLDISTFRIGPQPGQFSFPFWSLQLNDCL